MKQGGNDAEKIILSCREAVLMLKVMPLNKEYCKMKPEEVAVIDHHMNCDECKLVGLSEIIGLHLECQDVLETVASRRPGPLFTHGQTLKELLAVEHIWGRKMNKFNFDKPFCESVCLQLRCYWDNASISIFYDGEREVAKEIPFLIRLFTKQQWSIKKLLEIQRERVDSLCKALVNKKKIEGYQEPSDIVFEIFAHLNGLQDLLSVTK